MKPIKILRVVLICASTIAVVGCGSDEVIDGGPVVDASANTDGSTKDGGVVVDGGADTGAPSDVLTDAGVASDVATDVGTVETDTQTPTDTLTSDLGAPDAGAPDAGTPDADSPDADSPDADSPDADSPDAGPDASAPDAGTPDAGTPDAGAAESTLCNPCGSSKECATSAQPNAACVAMGPGGAFCGNACTSDADCDADYICSEATTIEGVKSKQCVRAKDKGECSCSKTAAAQGLSTSCYVEDPNGVVKGQCPGTRACSDKGLSACSAQAPTKELCDGDDDNCDGQIDEDTCDDGEPCTKDVCAGKNGCTYTSISSPCNDGDACTDNDACNKGKCLGAALKCDDNNPCTDDSCDKAKGCVNLDNSALCDDGDKCTSGDGCKSGACAPGTQKECNDSNPCTTDKCNAKSGACDFAASVTPTTCDDGDACTDKDLCKGGKCVGGAVACDDGDPCTTDLCSKAKGCENKPNTAFCDDGDACTTKDVCKAGTCAGAAIKCDDGNACTDDLCDKDKGCTTKSNAATCDDGDKCTKGDVCSGGTCGGSKLACDDGKICTDDSCDKNTGCVAKNNAAPCDDGDKCTEKDYCAKGACKGSAIKCDDGNSCTDDSCDKVKGCVTKNNTATCEDGNKCSEKDLCSGGVCKAGGKKTCDDKDACTADSCEPVSGKCVFKAISNCKSCTNNSQCNDKNPCTTESCKAGKCQGSVLKDGAACDDGSFCTAGDACKSGSCVPGKTAKCDDKNPCTADVCDAVGKKCNNIPLAKGFKCGAKKVLDDYKCVGASVYKRAGFPGCSGSTTAPKCSTDKANLSYLDFVKISTCKLPQICRIEASGGFCGLPPQPDLQITGFKLDKTVYSAGAGMKVTWTVKNSGIVASPKVKLAFYVSVDTTIGNKGDIYKGAIDVAPIKAGGSLSGAYTILLRSNRKNEKLYAGGIIDSLNAAKELNEKNNIALQKFSTIPAADIAVYTSSRPQVTTLAWGQKSNYYRYTRNIGTVTVGKHTDRVWLSADMKVDKSDISLTSFAVPELKPNAANAGWVPFTMPKTVKPGTWYIIFQADASGQVAEGNEANNYRVTKITYKGFVDLQAVSLKATTSLATGTPFTVEYSGKNLGNATSANFYDRVYFSKDTKLGSDVYLGYSLRKAIKPGASYATKSVFNIPSSVGAGTWYLLFKTDSSNQIKETNELNNIKVLKVNIVPMANLRTYYYKTYATSYYVNQVLRWNSYDRNYGTLPTKQYLLHYYISADDKFDAKDQLLAKFTRGPLKYNQAQSTVGKWTIPGNYKPGKYWLFIKTDATNVVKESNETDNLQKYAFTIKGRPDLVGTVKASSSTLTAGVKATVALTWKNIGLETAVKHSDRIYLNTKKAYGGTYLGQRPRDALAPGKGGSETFSFVPSSSLKTGTYYLNYRVDALSQVSESNEGNNISYHEIKIVAVPDLYPYTPYLTTYKPTSGQTVGVTWYVRNGWLGTAPQSTVRFVLSKDTKYSKDDILVANKTVPSLAYGKITPATKFNMVIPKTMTGAWNLLAIADPDNKIPERLETNNLRYRAFSVLAVPDVAVTSLVTEPTKAKTGSSVKVTAKHKNLGNKSASFTAALYLVVSSKQSVKLMEKLQPTLAAGKESTTTESVVIPGSVKPGTYKLRWVVTVSGEVNKTNNLKEAAFTVL